ncbi:MAG: aminotransferase class I/II-fold pyridoxal phosphate-dependent enzyme [Magnetococcales bacterium]|nr:aminotransferase class I/II-fold pyridoxal phosphate-dependent enzyme [Magnetococcales bacterium]
MSRIIDEVTQCAAWLENHGEDLREWRVARFPDPVMILDGREVLSFSSNNYLGLSFHPRLKQAGREAIERHTMGTCESRRLGGNLEILEQLEERLAAFKGTPSAMVFATGLLANVAVIPAMMRATHYCTRFFGMPATASRGVIFSDAGNHRSIAMGCTLSGSRVVRYRHGDVAHLAELLESHASEGPALIVTDGVFSMEGDLAPLPELVSLAKTFEATLMVDDAHGTGVYGANGRGIAEHFGVEEGIDLHMGTLSKALGGLGGFVGGPRKVIEFLKFSASGYRFTSGLPAEQAAGALAALDLLKEESWRRERLWRNVHWFLHACWREGLPVPLRWSPIIPYHVGSAEKARRAQEALLEAGLLCVAAAAPLVPEGAARLRLTLSATHETVHLQRLVEALRKQAGKLDLPPGPVASGAWQDFVKSAPDYVPLPALQTSGIG